MVMSTNTTNKRKWLYSTGGEVCVCMLRANLLTPSLSNSAYYLTRKRYQRYLAQRRCFSRGWGYIRKYEK